MPKTVTITIDPVSGEISIIPAKVMREFRLYLIENTETPEQLETALQEGHERICCKEKAQPVRVELGENNA